ncbi:hypothetical protein MC885_002537 [Smutsia gigantea]|nr:hypothetical protein MC885_002537 [Smutsia gigantea]
MAAPWSGQTFQALPATVLGALGALGSDFLREWEAQDMRVTLFKLLLLWLVLSLLGIQLAWGFYGSTVTGLYHRPDPHPQPAAALHVFLPQVWAARMDPHLMAPRISHHGKQQRMNLSKPIENKGKQQRGLQGRHQVCWLPRLALLLPRPQRQLQERQDWEQRVPQCLQGWVSSPLGPAWSHPRHWTSEVCLCPDLGVLRKEGMLLLSGVPQLRRCLWGGEANSPFSVLVFSCPSPQPPGM